MKKHDGGPAFPVQLNYERDGDTVSVMSHDGMSLRAYAAVVAMKGLLSGLADGKYWQSDLAAESVNYADALIAELEKEDDDD